MSWEKVVGFAREFSFGFIVTLMIMTGIYSMRQGLTLGIIGSGSILLYLVYSTRDSSTENPRKKVELSGSQIWKNYLKKHPDMCPLCARCPENLDHLKEGKCHNGSYPDCETYLNREEETENVS